MNSTDILNSYEEMLGLSQKMLSLARQGDWDQLAVQEKERSAIVERLKKQEEAGPELGLLGMTEQTKKGQLIRAILAADAEIMALSESWIAELQGELRSSGNEYKLIRAYGAR